MLSFLTILSVAHAGTPILAGELAGSISDSAYTIPAGQRRLQIFSPSSYGVSDDLELSVSLLGLLAGPNLTAELGLIDSSNSALSIKPSGAWYWNGGFSAGADVLYTLGSPTENRLTFSGGASYNRLGEDGYINTQVRTGYDLVVREDRLLQLSAYLSPYNSNPDVGLTGGFGAGYTWAWQTYRLQLGVVSASTNTLSTTLENNDVAIELPTYVPLPYLLMWWTF